MKLLTKRIGVLGHGVEGASLADFLKSRRVRDLKIYDEKQNEFSDFSDFSDRDVLFRSPGISPNHPALQGFSGKIVSGTDLFLQLCPTKKIIGITGTKGKGTTATLVSRAFEEANDTTFLVGNIGNPFFADLPKMRTRDVVVAELSSFQLWDCGHSPQIAVLLRMSADHLEVHDTFDEYVAAKKNIFLHQKTGGRVVFCADCPVASKMVADLPAERKIPFSTKKELPLGAFLRGEDFVWRDGEGNEETIAEKKDIKLAGDFNHENILAAIAAAKLLNIRTTPLSVAISKFRGLPFRLQLVAKNAAGTAFFNDSAATNPAATAAAIKSLSGPTILMAGGSSKNASFAPLGTAIADANPKAVIAIGETGPEILAAAKSAGYTGKTINAGALKTAFAELKKIISDGDTVVFSPASASFDQFENAKDRGEKWTAAVNEFLRG